MALPNLEIQYTETRLFNTLSSDGKWGPYTRRSKFPDIIRRWRISYELLSESEKASIQTEFATSKGGAGPFTYTPIGESSINARFVPRSLRFSARSGRFWTASFEIEELLLNTTT